MSRFITSSTQVSDLNLPYAVHVK